MKVDRGQRRVALVIALGVILLTGGLYLAAPDFLYVVEFILYDGHFHLRGTRPPNPQVVIVAIDQSSLAAVGRWPWSRAVLAELVRRLDEAGAAVIAFDILMLEPERSPEHAVLEALGRRLRGQPLDTTVRRELERMRAASDADATLAAAIGESGRVVLASDLLLSLGIPTDAPERRGAPLKSAIASFQNYKDRGFAPPLRAQQEAFPIPPLLTASAGVGHVKMVPEIDGAPRATRRW
jgi:CHASE2 domain-containing sensor protein